MISTFSQIPSSHICLLAETQRAYAQEDRRANVGDALRITGSDGVTVRPRMFRMPHEPGDGVTRQPLKRERGGRTMTDPVQFNNPTLCDLVRRMREAEKSRDAEFFEALLAEKLTPSRE